MSKQADEARQEILSIPHMIEGMRLSSAEGGDISIDALHDIRARVIELSRENPEIFDTVQKIWRTTAMRFTHPCPPDFREENEQ